MEASYQQSIKGAWPMTARLKKLISVFALVTLVLYSYGAVGKPLKSIKSLGKDELVLVGRIELIPPLEDFEQNLKTIGSKRYKNVAMFVIGDQVIDIESPRLRDGKYADGVALGEDFYLRRKRREALIYSGSLILTQSALVGHGRRAGVNMERIILPGGLTYDIRGSDKAVYIGTIRYHRDDYNAITKIDVINEFKKANQAFIERFGDVVELRSVKPARAK
jgi:hypothetical protein